jgi:HSP20 family protein
MTTVSSYLYHFHQEKPIMAENNGTHADERSQREERGRPQQSSSRAGDWLTEITRPERWRLPWWMTGEPFVAVRRLTDEIDRLLEDAGFGPGWIDRGRVREVRPREVATAVRSRWMPEIELFQRGEQLVVRADLPGMKKEDVQIRMDDDTLTIEGERHQEEEVSREGLYRSERTYGSFSRTIPIPPGAGVDEAKANYSDGVLEITMPAPQRREPSGRQIEIQ